MLTLLSLCPATVVWPDSHQRMTQVQMGEKINLRARKGVRAHTHTHTHTQYTVLQICRLYRKEGKFSGALEVSLSLWKRFGRSLPPPLWEHPLQILTAVRHHSCLSEDFWTRFMCFDRNTIVRFLILCVSLGKTVLSLFSIQMVSSSKRFCFNFFHSTTEQIKYSYIL